MATVTDLLSNKSSGSKVLTIGKEATVITAADIMNEHKIGALVVSDDEKLTGIFTERDVLRRVVGKKRDPETTTVGEVMTSEVACCTPNTAIEEAGAVMKKYRVRHLPIVSEEMKLVGIISIGDLNAYHANTQEVTIQFLHEYLYGRT